MAPAYSDYGSVSSMRGDIPLVVKCTFDRSMRRITFQSAQTCTYELLRARVSTNEVMLHGIGPEADLIRLKNASPSLRAHSLYHTQTTMRKLQT
jgi:hypothetical protein